MLLQVDGSAHQQKTKHRLESSQVVIVASAASAANGVTERFSSHQSVR